jgi:hypothetical protein
VGKLAQKINANRRTIVPFVGGWLNTEAVEKGIY